VRAAAGVSVGDVASYDDEKHVLTIKGDCTVSMSVYAEKTTTDKIVVDSEEEVNIVLDGVYIDFYSVDSYDGPPFSITSTAGPVNITLADGSTNILKSSTGYGGSKYAGLQKDNEAMLTINGSTGKLIAQGGLTGAGIGGENGKGASNITINGGIITAYGVNGNGAGIGGGQNGSASNITINGGIVGATGNQAAGIGGGSRGSASNITINGGLITAQSDYGASIGSGWGGTAENIIITGGTVEALGQYVNNDYNEFYYDGTIGFGLEGSATGIKITGGNVKTTFGATFGRDDDVPTNDAEPVYRAIFTVPGITTNYSPVDLTIDEYSTNDIVTLDTDKVYVYLPEGKHTLTYEDIDYTTTVTTEGTAVFSLTDAGKVAAAKAAIETVVHDLAVSNETTAEDVLSAATKATLYGVTVAWDSEDGFNKKAATSVEAGWVTGTLNLTLGSETATVVVNKTINKLPEPEKVATPVITLSKTNADNREGGINFTIGEDAGVTFYYTLDGTDPTISSTKYEEKVTLPAPDQDDVGTITIKVIGVKSGSENSDVAQATVTYAAKVAPAKNKITINAVGGTVTVTTDPVNEAAAGSTVTVNISEVESGKVLKSITVTDVEGGNVETIEVIANAEYYFVMPNKSVTVKAEIEDIPISTYAVTVNGSYDKTSGAGNYSEGDTVTINAGSRPGYSFKGWISEDVSFTNANASSTAFIMPNKAVTVTATWKAKGGGSSSSGSSSNTPSQYAVKDINHGEQTGGNTKLSREKAKENEIVTITIIPDPGYDNSIITVFDKDNNPVAVTDNGDGTYSFKMPAGEVAVDVQFTKIDYFDDVDQNDWYDEAAWFCSAHGLMSGTDKRRFDGNVETTRAMLVAVLYRLSQSEEIAENIFKDVENGKWYTEAINWAAKNNIVFGYGDGNFGPNDILTREQMVSILLQYSKFMGYDVSKKDDLSAYHDADKISDWARDKMQWGVANGLITGVGNNLVSPQTGASRAQLAVIIQRYYTDFVERITD